MKIINILISTVVTASSLSLSAQSVDERARMVASTNPSIAGASYAEQARLAEMKGENILEDPTFELEQMWGNKEIGNKFTVGVSQEFDFPTVYSARRDAISTMDKSLKYLGEIQYLDIAYQAKIALIDYIYARKNIERLTEIDATLDSLATLYNRARSCGEMTQLDVNKLRIERVGVTQRIRDWETKCITAKNQLAALSGNATSDFTSGLPIEYPLEKLQPLDTVIAIALAKDPTILYNSIQSSGITSLEKLQNAERLPSFSLGYKYSRENGANFHGLGFGMSLPIYSSASKKKALSLQREVLASQSNVKENEIISQLTASYNEAEQYRRIIIELRPLLEDEDNLSHLARARDTKVITLIEYLQELNYFTEASLSLYETEYNLAVSLAGINRYNLLP